MSQPLKAYKVTVSQVEWGRRLGELDYAQLAISTNPLVYHTMRNSVEGRRNWGVRGTANDLVGMPSDVNLPSLVGLPASFGSGFGAPGEFDLMASAGRLLIAKSPYSFTAACWIDAVTADGPLISLGEEWALAIDSGALRLWVNGRLAASTALSSGAQMVAGAVSADGPSAKARLFVNGVQSTEETLPQPPAPLDGSSLTYWSAPMPYTPGSFRGHMESAAVWGYAVSAARLRMLYGVGAAKSLYVPDMDIDTAPGNAFNSDC